MQRAGQARLLSFRKNKRSKNMSNKWAFIGGILAGIAGVFAAAFAATEPEAKGKTAIEGNDKLALPEGNKI